MVGIESRGGMKTVLGLMWVVVEIALSQELVGESGTDVVVLCLAWVRIFLSLARTFAVGIGYPGLVRIFLSHS